MPSVNAVVRWRRDVALCVTRQSAVEVIDLPQATNLLPRWTTQPDQPTLAWVTGCEPIRTLFCQGRLYPLANGL